ncbi:MAG TPA: hypothetical protein VH595_18050 [Verrucomicrobiae bacterium]|jgi:hypothetical protein|nr:hypothetical protein [Verrucomicrobiae bacterium]
MKKLLAKFRISNALDKESAPDSQREKIEAPSEARDFAQRAVALDRALRVPPSVSPTDATLHNSIMRAVRASAKPSETVPTGASNKIWLAMTSGAFAAVCVWLLVRPSAPILPSRADESSQTLAAAQNVLDMSAEVSRSMPAAVVGPLSNELASVDHDIRNTTQFVLATLP